MNPRCGAGAGGRLGPGAQGGHSLHIRHRNAGQRSGRRQQGAEHGLHLRGLQKGALPAGSVVQHQATHIQAANEPQRQCQRRHMQHQRGACGQQRRDRLQPLRLKRLQGWGRARVFTRALARTHAPGQPGAQPAARRLWPRQGLGPRQQQAHAHQQVPHDDAPHRGREQVDALAAADGVHQQAHRCTQQGSTQQPHRAAQATRQRVGQGCVAGLQALQRMPGALGQQLRGGRAGRHRFARQARGPGAVLCCPQAVGHAAQVKGLHQQHAACAVFVKRQGGRVHGRAM